MKLDKHAMIRRQLTALDGLGIDGLRRKFEEIYGFATPSCNEQNLRFRIAYRLQELHFGSLSPAAEDLLDAMADADPLANLQRTPARNYSHTRGTRFVRAWHGREYAVTVLGPKQFEYDHEMYTSLTAVARRITGTHQSGKSFFGVQK